MDRLTRLKIAARLPVSVLWGKVRDAAQRRRTDRALRVSVAERGLPTAPCTFRPLGLAPIRPAWYTAPHDHLIRAFGVAMPTTMTAAQRASALADVPAPARATADAAAAQLGPDHVYTDWWSDPRTQGRWEPSMWHRDVASRRGDDIKYPLEAGRLHSLVQWSLDPSSADRVRTALLEFIACNPACYGVQWCSGIDVGLRALNICLALEWSGVRLRDEEHRIVAHALGSHAIWLEHYIEWSGGMRTSHYLANLLGLLAIGSWLPDHPDAWRWRQRGHEGLEREFDVQFLDDGMNFEASTAYHRHCIDIMAWATRILRVSNVVSDSWMSRLVKGLAALNAFTLPDGSLWPVIGDTDSGLAVKLIDAPRVNADDLLHSTLHSHLHSPYTLISTLSHTPSPTSASTLTRLPPTRVGSAPAPSDSSARADMRTTISSRWSCVLMMWRSSPIRECRPIRVTRSCATRSVQRQCIPHSSWKVVSRMSFRWMTARDSSG